MTHAFTVGDLVQAVDRLAPFELAEAWDNVGLQAGDPACPARRVGVALEVTPPIVNEARVRRLDALIVHHPLIFKPLKSVARDTPVGAMLSDLIAAKIALIAAHTNLDAAPCGTNAALVELLGLRDVGPLLELAPRSAAFKIVVFVPAGHECAIVEAIHRGGGGVIGAYDHCAFRTAGVGSFRPLAGARPFAGEVGKIEEAAESRLEAEVPAAALGAVLREVFAAHPYEEVAHDVYPRVRVAPPGFANGLVGRLPRAATLGALARRLRRDFDTTDPLGVVGDARRAVSRVAVFAGAGAHAIEHWRGQADALLTGELGHHAAREAEARGIAVIAAGHFASERPVVPFFAKRLQESRELAQNRVAVLALASERSPYCRAPTLRA